VRPHYGVITDRYKLVRYFGTGEDYTELYDREQDPNEVKSRWGDPAYAATTADLEKQLARLRTELKVPETVPASWLGNSGAGGGKKKAVSAAP
jgi:hypothetical protein